MLNLYPGISWCIKQTYFFHKFILHKDFFKKKKKSAFLVRLALFLLGAYVKSLLLFLKCFLTRQFYEFSIHCCSFPAGMLTFLKNFNSVFYFTISSLLVLIVHGMYGTPCYYTRMWFSLLFVDFYFTLHIAQSTIITMVWGIFWLDTMVWYSTVTVKQGLDIPVMKMGL